MNVLPKIRTLLAAVITFFALASFQPTETGEPVTETQGDIFREIENAMGLGNAKLLAVHMATSVEVEVQGQGGIYSRSQAEQVLNKFFNKYPPTSFQFSHKGNSSAGARFAVGDYVTGKDHAFRVTIFLKKNGENYLIQEMEFE